MSSNNPTPLPLSRIAILGMILSANNTSIWMIFSFLPFMIKFYYPDYEDKDLGYRAGILASAFSTGSFFGAFLWGDLADRLGRRPAILYGLLGTIVSAMFFGFSPSFLSAVLCRFSWGLLNGNVGVTKTYLAEILDDSNTAKGMAIFGVMGGVGRTIGPIIGGYLWDPVRTYPGWIDSPILARFPMALPSIAITINCFVVLIVSYFFLPETLQSKLRGPATSAARDSSTQVSTAQNEDELERLNPQLNSNGHSNESDDAVGIVKDSVASVSPRSSNKAKVSFSNVVSVKFIGSALPGIGKLKSVDGDAVDSATHSSDELTQKTEEGEAGLNCIKETSGETTNESGDGAKEATTIAAIFALPASITKRFRYDNGLKQSIKQHKDGPTFFSKLSYCLSRRDILVSTALYGTVGFVQTGSSEIFPLWVMTSHELGGFSWTAKQIANVSVITGALTVFSQLFMYPALVEKFGILHLFRIGCICFAVSIALLPSCSTLSVFRNSHPILIWMSIGACLSLMNMAVMWMLTSVFVMINHSCYSHERGTVNGIGQGFAAIGRLTGPYASSVLFAISEAHSAWPINFYMVFYLLAVVSMFNAELAALLPRKIQRAKREPAEANYFANGNWEDTDNGNDKDDDVEMTAMNGSNCHLEKSETSSEDDLAMKKSSSSDRLLGDCEDH